MSRGDINARCIGSNTSRTLVFVCNCSATQFVAPMCMSSQAQQLAVAAQVQQFRGASAAQQLLSRQASQCRPGEILCPSTAPSPQTQQQDRLRALQSNLQALQQQMAQIRSAYSNRCESRQCPNMCPSSCSATNTSGCPLSCPLSLCFECDAQWRVISTVDASIQSVNGSIIRISNELPPNPNTIFSNSSNTCVQSIVQCFNTSSSTALVDAINADARFCADGGLRFCPLIGCVPQSTPCIPLSSCPRDQRRCSFLGFKDGRPPCVPSNETCPTTDIIKTNCPIGQSACPGGLQCAAGSGQAFFRVRFFQYIPSLFTQMQAIVIARALFF